MTTHLLDFINSVASTMLFFSIGGLLGAWGFEEYFIRNKEPVIFEFENNKA